jgi:putative membrane protein
MGLFAAVFLLELAPMVTLVRWRVRTGRSAARPLVPGDPAVVRTARRLARVSDVQLVLLVAIVAAAVLMARGYGARG